MPHTFTRRANIAGFAVLGVLATVGVGYAAIPATDGQIKGCYATTNGLLLGIPHSKGDTRIVDSGETCRSYEEAIAWNQRGPKGDAGPQGLKGAKGDTGSPGAKGETGTPGATGATGPQGEQGVPGATGAPGGNGAAGPQGPAGVSGYEIAFKEFPNKDGGTVLCPAGKRVLGGGAAILSDSGRWGILSSAPSGQSGWFVDLQKVKDQYTDTRDAHNGEFVAADDVPRVQVWAICASAN